MKPIGIRDFPAFRFVSTPTWSPDGSLIAFVVQQAEEMEEILTWFDKYLKE